MDVHFALLRACGRVRVGSIAAPRFGFWGQPVPRGSSGDTQYEAGRLLLYSSARWCGTDGGFAV